MRNIRLFFFVGIVLFFGGQSLYSQSKKEREEQKAKEIKEMIENGRFTIEVDRALPMGGRTVHLRLLILLKCAVIRRFLICLISVGHILYRMVEVTGCVLKNQLPIINQPSIRRGPLELNS